MLEIFERILYPSKIEKMETENRNLKDEMEEIKKECETLRNRLSGERVCGGYCDKCKNLVVSTYPGCFPVRSCLLDCKCKDFERV